MTTGPAAGVMPTMEILGHGVDLVETRRVAAMVERHGERFLTRCFTPAERAYADEGGRRRNERLAVRFAAKEAVLKALATGWRSGIAWTDVEVIREPSGRPSVKLAGQAARTAERLGVTGWLLSLSHTDTHAMASAIAVGGPPTAA